MKVIKGIFLLLALSCVYTALFLSFYYVIRYETLLPYHDPWNALYNFLYNVIPITTMFGLACAEFLYLPTPKRFAIKIASDSVWMTINLFVVNYAFYFVTGIMPEWGGTIFNSIFIFLGVETYYYVERYKETLLRETAANEELIMSRYQLLKSQVNPHFLFNSLNILNSLVSLDPEKAQEFVLNLGRIYRYIMEHSSDDSITLSKELDFMQTYLKLLRIRYGENIIITIEEREEVDMNKRMVPFTLQLLLENITKHNVISSRHPMNVEIILTAKNLTIRNRISPKKSSTTESSGVGKRYLDQLYRQHDRGFSLMESDGWYTAQVEYI